MEAFFVIHRLDESGISFQLVFEWLVLGQTVFVRVTRVLDGAIRVMDQAGLGAPFFDLVIERGQTKLGVDLERDGPAYDSTRVQIQDHGQIDEARAYPDVG